MKKQILFLSFFVLATLAGVTNVFGQLAVPGSAPRPLPTECQGNPLNPIPGVAYDYTATVDPTGGTAYWWAQFNILDFLIDGARTPLASQEAAGGTFVEAASNYQDEANTTTSTTITWKTGGLSQVNDQNPLFVALHYTAPTTACADNLKVYRITPLMPFQVNVIALGTETPGYGTEQSSCFDLVKKAQYDLTNSCMIYHYGQNVTAFEVVAAYFNGSYDASFRIEGLQAGQTARVFWSYTNTAPDFTGTPFATVLTNGVVAGPKVETTAGDTSKGVSIYVWVVVDNGTFEGLTDTPITFAAAGRTQTGGDATNPVYSQNVRWDNCDTDVDIAADLTAPNAPDYGIHNLLKRPTVTGTTNVGTTPTDFIQPCTTTTP